MAVPAVWHVGDVIDGRYRVSPVRGRGGMGLVCRARHLAWHPPRLADRDVDTLLGRLHDAGYGWLRPDGVRAQLHRMASAPSLPSPREEQQALLTVTANPGPGPADLKLKPVGLFRQMYEGWLEHLPSIHEARTGQVLTTGTGSSPI
ncbi:hypothetical protein ACUN3E_35125 [Streptomyces sp. Ju416(a)]|uniref:hypothetical protein n=1 Tax=Streptomyces sp. Ju416(a) TaxID=3446591 RepID=UPI00403E170E